MELAEKFSSNEIIYPYSDSDSSADRIFIYYTEWSNERNKENKKSGRVLAAFKTENNATAQVLASDKSEAKLIQKHCVQREAKPHEEEKLLFHAKELI